MYIILSAWIIDIYLIFLISRFQLTGKSSNLFEICMRCVSVTYMCRKMNLHHRKYKHKVAKHMIQQTFHCPRLFLVGYHKINTKNKGKKNFVRPESKRINIAHNIRFYNIISHKTLISANTKTYQSFGFPNALTTGSDIQYWSFERITNKKT